MILNNNEDNKNLIRNNINLNHNKLIFQKINVEKFTIKNKVDNEIDFMSNLNMNEFLYVLKKCFEAQYIRLEDIKNKVLNEEAFNILKLNQKTKYTDFIKAISDNFCKIIKVVKNKDKNDISSFIKTFLFNNYIENGNNIEEFQKTFMDSFKDIVIYDKNMEEKYIQKLEKYFKDKKDKLVNEFEFIDFNKSGKISFIALKKVVEKLKINIKNEILEYMIFFMKRSSINDINNVNNYSLRDLNYKIFLDKISSLLKTNNDLDIESNNLSEIENNNFEEAFNGNISGDNSLIEITNEEYNEKISLIINSISSEIMKKSNKNTEEYINKLFNKYVTTDENGIQTIELSKLVEEIKNSLFIEFNQIDIFCLYSRFQINENKNNVNNNELINFKSFKNEILLYANQILSSKKKIDLVQIENNSKKENEDKNVIKDINKIDENSSKNKEEIEEIKNQNEEYNDFEKNNFDYEI